MCTIGECSLLGPLFFILYTHDMWVGLGSMLLKYADNATLLTYMTSPNMKFCLSESLMRGIRSAHGVLVGYEAEPQ